MKCQVHIERRLQSGHSLNEPMDDDVLTAAFERYLRLEVLLNDKVRQTTCSHVSSVTAFYAWQKIAYYLFVTVEKPVS